MQLRESIHSVRERIAVAARQSGRDESMIRLIAVTKTRQVGIINEAISLGMNAIGENRVQELMDKLPNLLPCEAHLIGQLQSNKAKLVVGKVALIHSLDRKSLAEQIDQHAKSAGIVCDCLVQVNIGREPQKGGIDPADAHMFMESMLRYGNIRIKGLMCVPPICSGGQAREYFNALRSIAQSVNHSRVFSHDMTELSMGMSNDFETAIKCGATMVRIGSAIFGERVNQ